MSDEILDRFKQVAGQRDEAYIKVTEQNARIIEIEDQLEKCTQLLSKHWPASMSCNGYLQVAGHLGNVFKQIASLTAQLKEQEKLKDFARKVIEGESVDGGDIREWAIELGLLVPFTVTKDDGDFGVGDINYTFSDILKEQE